MDKSGRGFEVLRAADQMFVHAWRAVQPELDRRARRLADGHRDRADDLLANTAIKALLFMRRSPEAMTDPEGFLFVVLRHVFLDSMRRNGRDTEVFDRAVDIDSDRAARAASGTLSAIQRIELDEQLTRVIASIRTMTREQRRLFALRFVDELPYPAIAEKLGVNQPLVRKRIQLLRKRLKMAADR